MPFLRSLVEATRFPSLCARPLPMDESRGERRHGDGGQNSTRVGARAPNPTASPPAWRTSYDRAGWRRGGRRCCRRPRRPRGRPVSYTHLRAHETVLDLVCRLLLVKKKKTLLTNPKRNERLT